jgi:uncharacterized damage-inducible protein DinB
MMDQGLQQTYEMVKAPRAMLFAYLESMPLELYTREHPDVSWGNIRNIHLHVAECYEWWFEVENPESSYPSVLADFQPRKVKRV